MPSKPADPDRPPEARSGAGPRRLLSTPSPPELRVLADVLRAETVGGAILLGAALLALLWANSPWFESYFSLRSFEVGPEWGHLHLSFGTWAADGLLALFFLVAGLELKRELLVGELRDPRRAAVPVVAAVGGVLLPAAVYVAVVAGLGGDSAALRGWAIPTATDIAFALAVLAVVGSGLPAALRSFLLTLAVVDDLIAITLIAVFYTDQLHPGPLLLALLPLAAFAVLVQRRVTAWWLLVPLGAATWGLVHASGVHATVAGVLLGLVVPARAPRRARGTRPRRGPDDLAEHLEHRLRPLSAGFAVPVFAFFASGLRVVGGGVGDALADPVLPAVVAGLLLGKTVGVLGGTWAAARFTRARLDEALGWGDLLAVALLTGVGFTVSLLVAELAFTAPGGRDDTARLAVLAGSVLAAGLGALVLLLRRRARRAEGTDGLPTRDGAASTG